MFKISLKFVYKILPALIITIDNWAGKELSGIAIGNICLVENDEDMIRHELVHIKQFYRTFGLFPLLYRFSRAKRLEYEMEAYREQLRDVKYPRDYELACNIANLLYKYYDLRVSYEDLLVTLIFISSNEEDWERIK